MAQKSTIYKAQLEIADLNRHYYASHHLTLACHPSETTRRMLCRVFVFIHNASDQLGFTKGISTDDEPDLWEKTLTDEIDLWIDLGQPEERRIAKACGRSKAVRLYGYEPRAFAVWWEHQQAALSRYKNLAIWEILLPDDQDLEAILERSMKLNCTLQENEMLITSDSQVISVSFRQKQ